VYPMTAAFTVFVFFFATILLFIPILAQHAQHTHVEGWKVGQKILMECKLQNGEWGPGPTCQETNEQMTFYYGMDSFQYCGWHISSPEMYQRIADLIKGEANWNCRIPMVPQQPGSQHNYYLPFSIPVWGAVEKDHLHLDNHLNFIFHAQQGRILGVAAYPVRDRLQLGKEGAVITIHGPVKWFHGHSFLPFASPRASLTASLEDVGSGLQQVFISCALTALFGAVSFTLCYRFYLRRRLIRKFLKKD